MNETKPSNRNRTLFRILFLLFLSAVIYFLFDMSSQTTAPWKRKKPIELEK